MQIRARGEILREKTLSRASFLACIKTQTKIFARKNIFVKCFNNAVAPMAREKAISFRFAVGKALRLL